MPAKLSTSREWIAPLSACLQLMRSTSTGHSGTIETSIHFNQQADMVGGLQLPAIPGLVLRPPLSPRLELPEWITYDPTLSRLGADFSILRTMSHDGTFIHTDELLRQTLAPLLLRRCCKTGDDQSETHDPFYRVGPIRLASVFGRVTMRAGNSFPGQRESACIPVCITCRPHA